MITEGDPGELRRLRREYVRRMEAHPPSTWSPGLLSIVVNAIDLAGMESTPAKLKLRLIPGGAS